MARDEHTRQRSLRLSMTGLSVTGIILAGCDVYAVGVVSYLLLRVTIGESLWPVALANTFNFWLLLPGVITLLIGLWRRRWPLATISSAGVIMLAWWHGALFLPRAEPPNSPDAPTLTIMSFNLHADEHITRGVTDLVRAMAADVVGLEEVSAAHAEAIARDLADAYPHQIVYGWGIPGRALLSRYPIVADDLLPSQHPGRSPHLVAALDVNGRPLTVVVTHPPPPALTPYGYTTHPHAADEIMLAVGAATAVDGPAILMGDFNVSDQGDNYRLPAAAGLIDAFRAAGWGLGATWPVNRGLPFPLVRIDYIWHTPDFYTVRAWVGPDVGSDHLPVLAELLWRE